jgi:chemosensory pili system protein ChpA (sensor histidine kinase/response regulator)
MALDIEMPRMDGFDLARNIRDDALLKDLAIIMITACLTEQNREHAKPLGVANYLGKPYAEDQLMRLTRLPRHYCWLEAPAQVFLVSQDFYSNLRIKKTCRPINTGANSY